MAGGLKTLTPLRAIKYKCVDCSGGNRAEVRNCTVTMCSLWPFRPGARVRGHQLEQWMEKFEEHARKFGLVRANEGGVDTDDEDDDPTAGEAFSE